MSKAEPIEYEGYDVPNWVLRCKSIITKGPVLAVILLGIVILGGLGYWNHGRASYSDATQTVPDTSNNLEVVPSNLNLPTAATANDYSPVAVPGNAVGTPPTSPVGPAPTNSLQSLQPTTISSNPNAAAGSGSSGGAASNDALMHKLGL